MLTPFECYSCWRLNLKVQLTSTSQPFSGSILESGDSPRRTRGVCNCGGCRDSSTELQVRGKTLHCRPNLKNNWRVTKRLTRFWQTTDKLFLSSPLLIRNRNRKKQCQANRAGALAPPWGQSVHVPAALLPHPHVPTHTWKKHSLYWVQFLVYLCRLFHFSCSNVGGWRHAINCVHYRSAKVCKLLSPLKETLIIMYV